MQFPESWLHEFCDPPIATAELAERLTMSGLEVESLRTVAPPFRGVVVAKVLSVEPHPDAERGQRRAPSDHGRQDPRRRESRNAVLGARAETLGRPRRPAGARR